MSSEIIVLGIVILAVLIIVVIAQFTDYHGKKHRGSVGTISESIKADEKQH